ncbi:TetR/AcrR family transcriptional regulator [Kocuria tytonis]|uniref:TetR/AcrR family transcriptional regulator n=1 Tax=Kocuria tytonis TaxID=2054280 RepID=A0A495AAG2_9MICC|nr:TetR/AcrR family transcriptional regulator [Kocuria tytonis]RKQ36753.1 TetR/AcrR family transcriptional regulator [Kocuria tytonis]
MNAPDSREAPSGTPHARARRMSRDQRREQLLDTALRVFSDGGYHATSMDEIAAAAGVSKPVLYQHFPGKRELFLALVQYTLTDLSQRLEDSLSAADTHRDRVQNVIVTHFDFVYTQPQAYRLVFNADLMSFPEVAAQLDEFYQGVANAVAARLGPHTGVPHPQAMLLSRGLVHMVQTSVVYWTRYQETGSRQEVQDRIFRLAWGGIKSLGDEHGEPAPRLSRNDQD